ncbi:MAG: hypothetical protein JWL89_155 [Candidatus Saccharibacteria bacterium]|nr:hypothetical protein [Candidatus Saccharibacteria bacterium]
MSPEASIAQQEIVEQQRDKAAHFIMEYMVDGPIEVEATGIAQPEAPVMQQEVAEPAPTPEPRRYANIGYPFSRPKVKWLGKTWNGPQTA